MTPNTLLLLVGLTAVSATIVQPEWKIYYNLTTKKEFDIIDSNNPRFQYYKSKSTAKILRIGFGPIPCTCQHLTCGCCTGMNIRTFNFDRRACMNFTYDPYEFSLSMDMLMNDDSLFAQSISGKNPPPACLPVVIPYGPPLDFCVRFFNIHTPGYNIFICMDFETKIVRAPLLTLHFDCMQMGVDGIYHYKPEDALTGPPVEEGETQSQGEIEVYDEVFEEEAKNGTVGKKPEIKESESKPEKTDGKPKVGATDGKPHQETIKGESKPEKTDSTPNLGTTDSKPHQETIQSKPSTEPNPEVENSVQNPKTPSTEPNPDVEDSVQNPKKPDNKPNPEKTESIQNRKKPDNKPNPEKTDSVQNQKTPSTEPNPGVEDSIQNPKTPNPEVEDSVQNPKKPDNKPNSEKTESVQNPKTPSTEPNPEIKESQPKPEKPDSEPKQQTKDSEEKQEKAEKSQKQ